MDCSTIDLCVVPVPQGKDVLSEVLRLGRRSFSPKPSKPKWAIGSTVVRASGTRRGIARWCATARCRRGNHDRRRASRSQAAASA